MDERKLVHECECVEDHADLSNEYEYFSHIMQFPWHRLIPKQPESSPR